MKKIISCLLCLVLIFSLFCGSFNVSAVGEECEIFADKITAIPGDTVIVNLNIKNNPGIMAMTISVTYNASALEYVDYNYGDVFTDYTVAAHPNRNPIRLVISQKKDFLGDGVIASFVLKVKNNAECELHEISVDYSSGDFCNNDLVRLMPTIIPGGVDVQFNGSNCSHKNYSEWEKIVEPSCEGEGAYSRTCKKCGHFDSKPIDPVGHEFSPDWIVDIPATKEEPGTMSRHCIRCEKVTDETNFFLEDVEDAEIDNKYEGEVPKNDVISDIIIEQHPEIDFDNLNSNSNTSSKPSNTNNDSSKPNKNDKENSNNNSSKDDENSSDAEPNESDKENTENKIEDLFEILTPDDDNAQKAQSVANFLREKIPNFDLYFKYARIALVVVYFLVFI